MIAPELARLEVKAGTSLLPRGVLGVGQIRVMSASSIAAPITWTRSARKVGCWSRLFVLAVIVGDQKRWAMWHAQLAMHDSEDGKAQQVSNTGWRHDHRGVTSVYA